MEYGLIFENADAKMGLGFTVLGMDEGREIWGLDNGRATDRLLTTRALQAVPFEAGEISLVVLNTKAVGIGSEEPRLTLQEIEKFVPTWISKL
jgi:hypothetical protein